MARQVRKKEIFRVWRDGLSEALGVVEQFIEVKGLSQLCLSHKRGGVGLAVDSQSLEAVGPQQCDEGALAGPETNDRLRAPFFVELPQSQQQRWVGGALPSIRADAVCLKVIIMLILLGIIFIDEDEDLYRQEHARYCQADVHLFHKAVIPVRLFLRFLDGLYVRYDYGAFIKLLSLCFTFHFFECII